MKSESEMLTECNKKNAQKDEIIADLQMEISDAKYKYISFIGVAFVLGFLTALFSLI